MKRTYQNEQQCEDILKEVIWLAWQADCDCCETTPTPTKEMVWKKVYNREDIERRDLNIDADYVFGRMLKLRIDRPNKTTLVVPDSTPHRDYQPWSFRYSTYDALLDAAELIIEMRQGRHAEETSP